MGENRIQNITGERVGYLGCRWISEVFVPGSMDPLLESVGCGQLVGWYPLFLGLGTDVGDNGWNRQLVTFCSIHGCALSSQLKIQGAHH